MKVFHPLEFNKKNFDGSVRRNKSLTNLFNKRRLLKFLIKKKAPIIIDIGSNVGQSINFFRNLFSKSEIHSFEPNKDCFNILKKKYKNKNFIYLNNCAISNLKNEKKPQFARINNYLEKFGFYIYDFIFISKNSKNFRTDWVDILFRKKI